MRILIGIFIIILCFGSNSCQKEFTISGIDSTLIPPPDSSVSGEFTAKIDGIQFTANKFTGAEITSGVIAITGQDNLNQQIVLRVADSGVHVYTFDINSATNAAAYSKDNDFAYVTNQGSTSAESGGTMSVTSIDEVNKTISGTFSIKVYRAVDLSQKIISEGVFTNIPYDTQPIPPANSTDTFRVKVDGADFPVFSIDSTLR